MRDRSGITCTRMTSCVVAADLARGTVAAYLARGTHAHVHVDKGKARTKVRQDVDTWDAHVDIWHANIHMWHAHVDMWYVLSCKCGHMARACGHWHVHVDKVACVCRTMACACGQVQKHACKRLDGLSETSNFAVVAPANSKSITDIANALLCTLVVRLAVAEGALETAAVLAQL